MSDLKRILVTGANTGIGLALTKQLVSEHNCHVYLGSRDAERGAKAVEDVKKTAGGSVELLTIDVSNEASVKSAAASLSQTLGSNKLYAIVNNAGTGFSHGTSPPEILDTNTRGPRRVIDNFLPFLNPTSGRIINVGSGAGPMFFDMLSNKEQKHRYVCPMSQKEIEKEIQTIQAMGDDFCAYSGSKALLACYTMALAKEHPNFMVSIITPGYIKTNMTAGHGGATTLPHEGTVSIRKCLFEDLPESGYFWGSDGLRSPLYYCRSPGEPEYDGVIPAFD